MLDDIYDGSHIKSFAELQKMYGLPISAFYKCIQTKHLIKNLTSK